VNGEAGGTPSAFVGREDELVLLRQSLNRAVREPSAQLVTVVGEPGIGKTRLVEEFLGTLADLPAPVLWRRGHCLGPADGVAFWPLREIVRAQAGIGPQDTPEEAATKLAAEVGSLVPDPSEREWVRSVLEPLVGAGGRPTRTRPGGPRSGGPERGEVFAAWRGFIEAMAGRTPVVLVLEDVHWAEPPLLDFVEELLDWSSDMPMQVVCVGRPELYERRPRWGGGKRSSTTISLAALGPDETARLLGGLLREAAMPSEVQSALIERSGGNPLFAEQFVRMLTEQGILARHGRVWRLPPDAEMPVPGTARALITARIDALAPVERRVLEDASVFGTAFPTAGVAEVGGLDPAEVGDVLRALARRDLVRPSGTRPAPPGAGGGAADPLRPEYAFWHSLLHDVAYSLVPADELPARHRAAAAWIERAAGDHLAEQAEALANHYRRALQAPGAGPSRSDLERRAIRSLLLAGDRALQLDAAKALTTYREALALAPPGHRDRPAALDKVAATAALSGSFAEAAERYQEAAAALRDEGRTLDAGRATVGWAYAVWNQGRTLEARGLMDEALRLLELHPPGRELAEAYTYRAAALFLAGHPTESLAWGERALAIATDLGLRDLTVRIRELRGMSRYDTGDEGGIDDLRTALATSKELGLGEETARSYLNLANFVTPLEGPEAALRLYEEGIELAERRGLTATLMWLRAWALGVLFELGMWDRVLADADEVLARDRAGGGSQVRVAAEHCKAEVLANRGRLAEARRLMEDFLPRARGIGDPQIVVPALAIAAAVAELEGQAERAVPLIEELESLSRDGSRWVRNLFVQISVRVLVAAGLVDRAESLLRDDDDRTPRGEAVLRSARATVAEGRGRLEEAAEGYRLAAEAWAAYGFGFERARALLGQARCLVASGRSPDEPLSVARELFARLDARPFLAEADALTARATA
jgi:tetratricopeptide (TPR) repeat protein